MVRARSLFALLALVACTHSSSSSSDDVGQAPANERASAPNTPAGESRARGSVIATVVTHDAKVSILGSGGDLRVIVRKTDGALVADGISLDELRATDPTLHTIVTDAVAARGGTFLDATLYRAPPATTPGGPGLHHGR
jgi:hypothetical protein